VELLRALDVSTGEFGRRLSLATEDSWDAVTPCSDWDVRFLAAHVIGGNRFASAVLGGMRATDAIEQVMSSPPVGPDVMETWAATCSEQARSFGQPGVMDGRIDHPLGEITGREFLKFRVFDITLHAWDLARSLDIDDQLPQALVDVVLDIVQDGPPGMGFGVMPLDDHPTNASPHTRLRPTNASPQTRLLNLTGRQ
jgi:uncharacterized protein (TIGR03086 family)